MKYKCTDCDSEEWEVNGGCVLTVPLGAAEPRYCPLLCGHEQCNWVKVMEM